MRNFKFRAWDITYEQMFNHEQIVKMTFEMSFEGLKEKITMSLYQFLLAFQEDSEKQHGFKVMQFTGLTDKNGVEIYEGDILEGTTKFGWGTSRFDKYVVKWNSETCSFEMCPAMAKYKQTYQNFTDLTLKKSKKCLVLGNMFKNPELLYEAI